MLRRAQFSWCRRFAAFIVPIVLVHGLLASGGQAQVTTARWIGGSPGNFSNPNNWHCSPPPGRLRTRAGQPPISPVEIEENDRRRITGQPPPDNQPTDHP